MTETGGTETGGADAAALAAAAAAFREDFDRLRAAVGQRLVGQDVVVEAVLTALVAGGHVLLEGVPGLGKTLLVKTLAEALALPTRRVQFTPDLLPADLLGTNVLHEEHGKVRFEFAPGPIFCQLLLADEINRATPKTQSALLEAMQEGAVTTGGATRPLPKPFFVLATQNPLEQEGTYPLPEAQLDRFLFKVDVPYPTAAEFEAILDRTTGVGEATVTAVLDGPRLLAMARLAREVPVSATVRRRAVELVRATHPETAEAAAVAKQQVRYGASPRAGQALLLAGKIRALRAGRFHVATEDLEAHAGLVLAHRLILRFEAQADGATAPQVVAAVLEECRRRWRAEGS